MKKRLLSLALIVVILAGAAPIAAASADTPYYEWKQYDPRWASVTLTAQTMKQVGCLATSVAILAVHAGLRSQGDFDPGVFTRAMKKAGGFSADDDLLWEAIPRALPGLAAETPWACLEGTQAEKTAALKRYLREGYQVAVAVKHGGHWVALRTVADGKAVMMDPGSAATDLFEKYPASGVTRAALLRTETPKQTAATAPQPAKSKPPAATKEDYRIMAESVFAFLKDMGGLLLSILQYLYTLGK